MKETLTLKKNYEFQRVFKKGKWFGANLLNIYICQNRDNLNHIGITVSKKVSKSSVKRNRIRRLIREAYRLNEFDIKKGFNIVIGWKNDCSFELATFDNIQEDLKKCFKKADLINTNETEEDVNV